MESLESTATLIILLFPILMLKDSFVSSWSLNFDIYNKTSNQITKIIEAEAIELVNIAVRVEINPSP